MAAKKTAEVVTETAQEGTGEVKEVTGYKVIGDSFKTKREAQNAIREAHKKGFKGTGLVVIGAEFVTLFGSYETAESARANLEVITTAGFNAEIAEEI